MPVFFRASPLIFRALTGGGGPGADAPRRHFQRPRALLREVADWSAELCALPRLALGRSRGGPGEACTVAPALAFLCFASGIDDLSGRSVESVSIAFSWQNIGDVF